MLRMRCDKPDELLPILKMKYWVSDVLYASIDIFRYINMYDIDYPDDLIIREVVV